MSTEHKISYGLIGLYALLHLILISCVGLGVDEAHYGLYALKPDLSYFDHPPIVGWLLIPSQLFGPDDIGLRLTSLIVMVTNSFLLLRLTQRIYPNQPKIALTTIALFQLSLITQLLGWGMVPDVPLMTWNLLIIICVLKLSGSKSWQNFILLGFLMGIAGLTKYTAIGIPVAVVFWLMLEKQLVTWLKQTWLWVAILIAGILLSPVLYWNYHNDWISFTYQIDHGAAGEWEFSNMIRMQVAQLASFSPLNYVLGLTLIFTLFRKTHSFSSAEKLLLSMALIQFGLVAWSSGNGELLPHWASIGWLLITPVCATQFLRLWENSGKTTKTILKALAAVSVMLWAILFVLLAFKPVTTINGSEEAFKDLLGWDEAAQKSVSLAQQHSLQHIWVANWTHASRIAWYSLDSGMTVQVIDNKPNQFDLWNGEPDRSTSAILVTPRKHKAQTPREVELKGSQCGWLDELNYRHNGITINHFHFFLCSPTSD